MRRLVLLVGVVFLMTACHRVKLDSIDRCGASCFPDNARLLGVGVCHSGTLVCSEGGPGVCVDYQGPSEELCDGLDNDCDGVIDEFDVPCATACGQGVQRCRGGLLEACISAPPSPEVCNGLDDDCDGVVDEVEDLPVEFCYSGPSGTVLHGDCHPGTKRCVNGALVCVGDKVPSVEECDGTDNDCDGLVDENSAPAEVDVVFILDTSGSMGPVISNIRQATQSWATQYGGNSRLRFALVTAPDLDVSKWGPQVRLFGNFADAAALHGWMNEQRGATGSTSEPTLDALVDLSDPQHVFATEIGVGGAMSSPLSWRPGARRVAILFTDEIGQSYTRDPAATPESAAAAAQAGELTVHVFTATAIPSIVSSFEPVAQSTGGKLMDVSSSALVLEANLNSLIRLEICR